MWNNSNGGGGLACFGTLYRRFGALVVVMVVALTPYPAFLRSPQQNRSAGENCLASGRLKAISGLDKRAEPPTPAALPFE